MITLQLYKNNLWRNYILLLAAYFLTPTSRQWIEMFFYVSLAFCEKKMFVSHYCSFCYSLLKMADNITRQVPSMLSIIKVIITEILRVCKHRGKINVFISSPTFLSHDRSRYITKFQSEMKQYCQQWKEKYSRYTCDLRGSSSNLNTVLLICFYSISWLISANKRTFLRDISAQNVGHFQTASVVPYSIISYTHLQGSLPWNSE